MWRGKKTKEHSAELYSVEAEVYSSNNKKTRDSIYTYTYTPIMKIESPTNRVI